MKLVAAQQQLHVRAQVAHHFGGLNGEGSSDETWEWNGSLWSQLLPAVRPPARSHHAMAFDVNRNRIVLFGGVPTGPAATTPLGDFWEWDGTTWTQIPFGGRNPAPVRAGPPRPRG